MGWRKCWAPWLWVWSWLAEAWRTPSLGRALQSHSRPSGDTRHGNCHKTGPSRIKGVACSIASTTSIEQGREGCHALPMLKMRARLAQSTLSSSSSLPHSFYSVCWLCFKIPASIFPNPPHPSKFISKSPTLLSFHISTSSGYLIFLSCRYL